MAPWHWSAARPVTCGGVAGERLGHRHVPRPVPAVRCGHRPCGAGDGRRGELDGEGGVGEVVLHRLEAADRHAELLAVGDVGDGEVEHRCGQPDELRGRAERAPVEGAARARLGRR